MSDAAPNQQIINERSLIIDAQYRRAAIGLGLLRDRTNIDEEDLAAAMRKIQLRSGR